MSFDAGINFRYSSDYVTDGTNETYCIGDTYPTSRGGFTFGWDSTPSDGLRDRDSGVDRRLAGVNKTVNGSQRTFRLDLPAAGDYTIHVALGDQGSDRSDLYLQICDDTTVLATIDKSSGAGYAHFYDANGNLWTTAEWPGSETGQLFTFSSTILNVKLARTSGVETDISLAHLRAVAAASSSFFSRMALLGVG